MTVLFTGGGPAQGVFNSLPEQDSYRVADDELASLGKAAVYVVSAEKSETARHTMATAHFTGIVSSKSSLVDFYV